MSVRRGIPRGASRSWGELEAIELLQAALAPRGRGAAGVELGIGDDAAVIAPTRGRMVWTVDASVEGVHFDRRWLTLEDVGYRSLNAAASDLAAMGARPIAALSALVLPAAISRRELAALGDGQAEAARDLGCPVVGGNVARGGELSVTTTVLGACAKPLLRSGARVGDELWLVGDVGLARAGFELLRAGRQRRPGAAARACIAAWRRPRALLARGRALVGRAHAAIDVSDGLGGDARQLAASSGVRVVVDERALRAALPFALVEACARLDADPIALALAGGEDYALLATGAARRRPRWARAIGRVERGAGALLEPAVGGRARPLERGFDHLAR